MIDIARTARIALGAVTLCATAVVPVPVEAREAAPGKPDEAVYDEATLDLAESWGTAGACVELTDRTECYDTESELLAAHPELGTFALVTGALTTSALVLADCASSLRLYDGTSYTGAVLYLTTRQVVLNLSAYGFDNRTSSYKVGACGTSFYSLANAGGSTFSRAPFAQSTTMPSGWSNILSSVLIA